MRWRSQAGISRHAVDLHNFNGFSESVTWSHVFGCESFFFFGKLSRITSADERRCSPDKNSSMSSVASKFNYTSKSTQKNSRKIISYRPQSSIWQKPDERFVFQLETKNANSPGKPLKSSKILKIHPSVTSSCANILPQRRSKKSL